MKRVIVKKLKVTETGDIIIPAEIARFIGLNPNDEFLLQGVEGELLQIRRIKKPTELIGALPIDKPLDEDEGETQIEAIIIQTGTGKIITLDTSKVKQKTIKISL